MFNYKSKGNFMKSKRILILCAMFMFAITVSCKDDVNEPPEPELPITIEDLYAQPLDTIQKYVYGKWKIYLFVGGRCSGTYW